ncbi:tyrosine-type recombinase/integrase [Microtetraspora niveoalba]|uniref:tyrosine-type recombinase/integrase n=1 Tax=Microtetraspora niveoalba TaxID=46175 RepID=UPI000831941D|nr:tyrosine-type recombinase/integrase [Microtetraspora niveoalba]
MAYTEVRNGKIRVRWKQANGKYNGGVSINEKTGEPFQTEDEARQYGEDQETLIRLGLRKDRSKIKFGEWANTWYAGLALEPSTMRTYRSLLSGHLMPVFEERYLDDLEDSEFDPWERSIVRAGYAPRTARDARTLMINILGDAVPRYIDANPAARKRGKGKKGLRRIEAYQRAAKVWPSPGEAVLVAERAALVADDWDVFLMYVTKAWTGLRWSEILALRPESLLDGDALDVDTKIYELSGFYLGYPKDGSLRVIDVPPFLGLLLRAQAKRARTCTCTGRKGRPPVDGDEDVEWCVGGRRRYLFLTREGAHYGRGWSSATMRPAADGVYPGREDKRWPRPPRPVLADTAVYGPSPARGRAQVLEGAYAWPGRPVHVPWPYAEPGVEFVPPRGRGRPDYASWPEAERPHLVTWLPIRPGLTPHGFRHGHQTWMDDAGIKKALKVERMGHEDTSMSGRYGHVTEGMREQLRDVLQALWENALAERFRLWPTSPVPILDAALAPWREGTARKIVSQISPRNSRRALTG